MLKPEDVLILLGKDLDSQIANHYFIQYIWFISYMYHQREREREGERERERDF